MHGAGDRLQRKERVSRAGSFASKGEIYPKRDGKDRRGHEKLSEGNDGDVGGKADGGGAMKVICHGKGEAHLHYGRDQQQLERGEDK